MLKHVQQQIWPAFCIVSAVVILNIFSIHWYSRLVQYIVRDTETTWKVGNHFGTNWEIRVILNWVMGQLNLRNWLKVASGLSCVFLWCLELNRSCHWLWDLVLNVWAQQTFGRRKRLEFLLFISFMTTANAVAVYCEHCWARQECGEIMMASSLTCTILIIWAQDVNLFLISHHHLHAYHPVLLQWNWYMAFMVE